MMVVLKFWFSEIWLLRFFCCSVVHFVLSPHFWHSLQIPWDFVSGFFTFGIVLEWCHPWTLTPQPFLCCLLLELTRIHYLLRLICHLEWQNLNAVLNPCPPSPQVICYLIEHWTSLLLFLLFRQWLVSRLYFFSYYNKFPHLHTFHTVPAFPGKPNRDSSITSPRFIRLYVGWVIQHRSNLVRILKRASVLSSSFYLLILYCVLLLNRIKSAYFFQPSKYWNLSMCSYSMAWAFIIYLYFFNKLFVCVHKCLQSYFIIFF